MRGRNRSHSAGGTGLRNFLRCSAFVEGLKCAPRTPLVVSCSGSEQNVGGSIDSRRVIRDGSSVSRASFKMSDSGDWRPPSTAIGDGQFGDGCRLGRQPCQGLEVLQWYVSSMVEETYGVLQWQERYVVKKNRGLIARLNCAATDHLDRTTRLCHHNLTSRRPDIAEGRDRSRNEKGTFDRD